jgi:hypothetical protein
LSNFKNGIKDKRHRQGPEPICQDQIDRGGEMNNIKRCRKKIYKTKVIETKEMTELETLEETNRKLSKNKQTLKGKIRRSKSILLKMGKLSLPKLCQFSSVKN